jgi:hypothetical protein
MASTNSAVISAACHQPPGDHQAYMFPVKWGVVGQDKKGIGHCSFTTARDVGRPVEGNLYL